MEEQAVILGLTAAGLDKLQLCQTCVQDMISKLKPYAACLNIVNIYFSYLKLLKSETVFFCPRTGYVTNIVTCFLFCVKLVADRHI